MLFEDLNWMDVEAYLKQDDRVIVITGACEQHAYLSLQTDIRAPLAMARAAAEREKVLVAPPINFGISPQFLAFPGTISLRVETFALVAREVIGELGRQGFRRVLVSNGHGGNTGALGNLLIELGSANPGMKFKLFEWWTDPAVVAAASQAGLRINHANWAEAFPVNRVAENPAGEKPDVIMPRIAAPEEYRKLLGDGNFGGKYQAPDEVMDKLFEAGVGKMVEMLKAW